MSSTGKSTGKSAKPSWVSPYGAALGLAPAKPKCDCGRPKDKGVRCVCGRY